MAAWRDMADDAYDVCESHGQHVRVSDDYEWDGSLQGDSDAAGVVLLDGVDRFIASLPNSGAVTAHPSSGAVTRPDAAAAPVSTWDAA